VAAPSHPGSRVPRWLIWHEANVAGAVYGTIVVNAVVVASAGAQTSLGRTTLAVATTVVVFWLAHVYAHSLAICVDHHRRLTAGDVLALAGRERPILQAAVIPLLLLLAGVAGLLDAGTALWLAVLSGSAVLVGLGLVYARREGLGPLGTALSIAVNAAFGAAIVLLKAVVTH
jgi:hypothetical protein